MARTELWIKHDVRSRTDGKMRWFLRRAGMEGYGVFWATIELLHYQNDHEMPLCGAEFEGLADEIGIDPKRYFEILKTAVDAKLFCSQNGRLWQEKLKQNEAERSRTKQNAGRLGGLKSGETRKNRIEAENLQHLNNINESKQNEAEQNSASSNELDRRERIDKNRYNKKAPTKKSKQSVGTADAFFISDLVFKNGMGAPEVREALAKWFKFKADKKQSYRSAQAAQALIDDWQERGGAEFIDAVQYSIAQNYNGVFPRPKNLTPIDEEDWEAISRLAENEIRQESEKQQLTKQKERRT